MPVKDEWSERHALTSTCTQGTVVSEGDAQLNAAAARSAFGSSGSGVQVGVTDGGQGSVTREVLRSPPYRSSSL